jgi:hypothetical protein
MITIAYVELCEILRLGDAFEQFADQGKRVAILGCDLVEATIVDAETETAVSFLCK